MPANKNEINSAAGAAKLVSRPVQKIQNGKPVFDKDKQPVFEDKPIKESEVLSFRDYGDHVVVVTTDGHKFCGDK